MDTELFKEYFKTDILKVSGRMFPVNEIYKPYSQDKDIVRKIERLFDEEILSNHQMRK